MPHCIIEYSKDIEIDSVALMDSVFNSALDSELFEENHIKTRLVPYEYYQKGALKEKFLHVTARILSGRTLEQRTMLSQMILTGLDKLNLSAVVITVEIVEMERESYMKNVENRK